ncbi:MAG: HipA domain-containing protein [Saprospiraceae bacterium]
MAKNENRKDIYVFADWTGLKAPTKIGMLSAQVTKGHEDFYFEYDKEWLSSKFAILLDPELQLYSGPQYPRQEKVSFGVFTDSTPDRWGKVLMQRREAMVARQEQRKAKPLFESDYLLGVFDQFRMGGLRYKLNPEGQFLDNQKDYSAPPFIRLRELEAASLKLEDKVSLVDEELNESIKLLIAPGASLGGARPKASILDPDGNLWIAKFPSRLDDIDIGGWESVVNQLATKAGINVAEGYARKFTTRYHTYLTKRFDRTDDRRIHFASALTLMGLNDGTSAKDGQSYLQLAECIVKNGAQPNEDLKELWTRIVFNICVSNTDDHLRNHGFLLTPKGWVLSPAYDMNPVINATGLHLNINEYDNALDLELAREVAPRFRISQIESDEIILRILQAVRRWGEVAKDIGLERAEILAMEPAFKV